MIYRNDPDLLFLSEMSSKELCDLVYILTNDEKGNKRLTEELTSTEEYQLYYPDHSKYWN